MNRILGKIISMIVAIITMIVSFYIMQLFIHGNEYATLVLVIIAFGFGLAAGKIVRRKLVV